MLSSLNAFGGLSAADVLKLFGANSASSTSATTPSPAQTPPPSFSASSASDPAKAIKAILAEAQIGQGQIGTLGGDSVSLLSESATIASPGALQQIANAVSLVNSLPIYAQSGDVSSPITVTAADAVNVTFRNGAVLATAMQGATYPNGLPSLASIQQALNELKGEDEATGWNGVEATPESTAKDVADTWWNSVDGSFTLVQLPPNASGAIGGNIVTFGSSEWGPQQWALVLPQNSVSVAASYTKVDR